jgi:D-alanyl-D-alanine carboxypeptidase
MAAVVLLLALTVGARLGEPAAAAKMSLGTVPTVTTPGAVPAFAWAAMGESAVAVPSLGVAAQTASQTPVPVASLTKLVTAYVILHDHPLAVGADGPSVTIGQVDVEDFEDDTGSDQANVKVALGETLTERQLLEGLVVHSPGGTPAVSRPSWPR